MNAATNNTLALTSNWLQVGDQTNATVAANTATIATKWNPTYTVWPYNWCYHYDGPARPIKLKLSEIEKLRAAARKDKALKAILSKFTDLIQITVDFE